MKIKSTKLIAMLLAVCMMFSFSSVAFAKEADGRVDINGSAVLQDLIVTSVIAYNVAASDEFGYLKIAADGVDIAVDAVKLAKDYVEGYALDAELEGVKALMLNELDNTVATLGAVSELLSESDGDLGAALAGLLEMEGNLYAHLETLTELALEVGIVLDPYLAQLEEAVNGYAEQLAQIKQNVYQNILNTVSDINATYAAFVEEMGAYADYVDPALGLAVRKFLTETPEDTFAILAAYGDEAVVKLVNEAIVAYGEISLAVSNLADVLYVYGTDIYEALAANEEVQALLAEINEKFNAVFDAVVDNEIAIEEYLEAPFSKALIFYFTQIYGNEAELFEQYYPEFVELYNELYEVAVSAIADVDELAADAFGEALDALVKVLCISGEAADGYLAWLCSHSEAMGAALLSALIENFSELVNTACPIIDAKIWALLAQIDAAILEFLPIADQWLYDWLYNNPEKVDAFFREYGDEIACLAEEYGDEVVGVLAYIAYEFGDDVVEYVIENPEESLELFMKWYNKYGYRIWPMLHVYVDYYGICQCDNVDDIYAELVKLGTEFTECFIEMLEEILEDLDAELRAHIEEKIEELKALAEEQYAILEAKVLETIALLTEEYEKLVAWYEESLYDATHAEYCICGGEHDYVALGGNLTVSPSYADLFAAALEAASEDSSVNVQNLAYTDEEILLTANNLVDYVKSNAAAIAGAEIITYNMDATDTIAIMLNAIDGNFVDWTAYADAETIAIAEKVQAEVQKLLAEVYDAETLAALDQIVEILVYAAVSYGAETYEALETIAAINPDALIAVVGMVNPFVGTTVNYNGEAVNVGEIFDYAIEATDLYNEFYAILSGNVTFVSAAGAETFGAINPTEIAVSDNMSMSDMFALYEKLEAVLVGAYLTEAGHADVCEALLNAIAIDGEHTYGEWFVEKEAEIGVEGLEVRICSVCGHRDEKVIPALEEEPIIPDAPVIVPGDVEEVEEHFWCDGGDNCHCHDYIDLDNTMWYHQGVCYMIEKGHMIGIGENKWAPEQIITRAEIATILWRIAGSKVVDYELTFEDVEDGMWYTEAIRWAVAEGIYLGYGDGTFGPNDQITREQIVTVMYRYEVASGAKINSDYDMTKVVDSADISDWAVEAMTWAFASGIIIGTDVDVPTASPLNYATRAEVAMIFYRKLDNLLK